jgi:hypothetical protein
MTTAPDLSQLRANTLGFFAVIVLALAAFHLIAWATTQKQRQHDAAYCVAVWSGSTPDYRQTYDKLCKKGRLR